MPTPGPLELVIILVIALLILGPGKLPDVGAALGKSIREFRKASSDVQEAVTSTSTRRRCPRPRHRAAAGPGRPGRTGGRRRPPRRRRAPAAAGRGPDRRRAGRDVAATRRPSPASRAPSPDHGRRRRPARAGRHRTSLRPTRDRRRRPAAAPGDDSVMSLVDHLGELRTRLFRSILAVAVGSVLGFAFADQIRSSSRRRSPASTRQVLGVGDAFVIQVKIALVVGIILAMPVLLYQLWAFIAPGLTPSERKTIRPVDPAGAALLRPRRRHRLRRPAVRHRRSCSASTATASSRTGGRPVLRLRDHDVPRRSGWSWSSRSCSSGCRGSAS